MAREKPNARAAGSVQSAPALVAKASPDTEVDGSTSVLEPAAVVDEVADTIPPPATVPMARALRRLSHGFAGRSVLFQPGDAIDAEALDTLVEGVDFTFTAEG